jgi:hypothetical protein
MPTIEQLVDRYGREATRMVGPGADPDSAGTAELWAKCIMSLYIQELWGDQLKGLNPEAPLGD